MADLPLGVVGGVLHLEVERDVPTRVAVVGLGQRQQRAVDAVVGDEVFHVNVGRWHWPAPSPSPTEPVGEPPSPPATTGGEKQLALLASMMHYVAVASAQTASTTSPSARCAEVPGRPEALDHPCRRRSTSTHASDCDEPPAARSHASPASP